MQIKSVPTGLAAVALALLLTGCGGAPTEPVTTVPSAEESEPAEAVDEPEETQPEGTRENPIPYGGSVTIEEPGEAGGDAWVVTVNEPADITELIVSEAMELYDGDEAYVASSRPAEGEIHLGVSGTVQRLLDTPGDPFLALDVQFITSDGRTLETAPFSTDTSPWLMDIGEMYAPASSSFTEVFSVPAGTTGQVLITATDTGERFYFGAAE